MAASATQPRTESGETDDEDAGKSNSESNSKLVLQIAENTELCIEMKESQVPIVYHSIYNIGFFGMEKLHPFDAGKWGRIHEFLKEAGMINDAATVKPKEATPQDLTVVHTGKYLDSLKWSVNVAKIMEVPPVALVPNFIVQRKALKPFRFHTGGTILGAKLAVEKGWAINLGGGFHHCCGSKGGGFCAYADISLAVRFSQHRFLPRDSKIMIVDLDAHQGNGHARDLGKDKQVYIMDVYNRYIYPQDAYAKAGISRKVELDFGTQDSEYLPLVERHLKAALDEFEPQLLIYNAGTDILAGDPLGGLDVSDNGIIRRDEIVFQQARSRNIPILMVTSGGYQKANARIIADSILNLKEKDLIYGADIPEGKKSKGKKS